MLTYKFTHCTSGTDVVLQGSYKLIIFSIPYTYETSDFVPTNIWARVELSSMDAEINDILSLKWRYYCPKGGILDYWVTLIFGLLSYYILSEYKGL